MTGKTPHSTPTKPPPGTVVVYLTAWCPYCHRLRQGLDAAGVPYAAVDVEQDEAAGRYVEGVNGGNRVVPTVLFPDGSTLTNPPAEAVQAKLVR